MNGRWWFFARILHPTVAFAAMAWSTNPAVANDVPKVAFDVSYVVPCVDITPAEALAVSPHQRLIEARFQVSVRLLDGNEHDIHELAIEIESPERRLRVVDFQPKTEVASDIEGPIDIVETKESANTLEAGLGGRVSIDYGPGRADLSPTAGAAHTQRNVAQETYHRLPARQLVLAAGTVNRQHGVFFKLKPTNQASLEGVHDFVCRFVVPDSWRGDWVEVRCRATAEARQYLSTVKLPCGRTRVQVGLFIEGDIEAQAAAVHVAEAQFDEGTSPRSAGGKGESSRPGAPELLALTPLFRLCGLGSEGKSDGDATAGSESGDAPSLDEALARLAALSENAEDGDER